MNRIEKLMKALPEGADAALITSDVNRRYFTGLGSTAGTLLAFRDAAYFIIDFRYIEVAKATVTGAEVILQDKLYDQLGELLKKHGARTVALETDYITVGSLEQYRSRLPQVEFLTAAALNDKILEMRSLKDEEEIAAIRKAQSITDAAFLEILDFIKPGKTEKEVAAYLEYCMRRLGADGLAFETIAAGGSQFRQAPRRPRRPSPAAGRLLHYGLRRLLGRLLLRYDPYRCRRRADRGDAPRV